MLNDHQVTSNEGMNGKVTFRGLEEKESDQFYKYLVK